MQVAWVQSLIWELRSHMPCGPAKKKKKRNEWITIHTSYKWFSQTYYWVEAAAAAAKLLQSCLTLCDPIDGSPPGSPVLGFSRQEHWSGLPFPSPMHESEKWKWRRSVMFDSSDPMDCSPPGSFVHGIFQAKVLEWGAIAFSVLTTRVIQICKPQFLHKQNGNID